MQKTHPTNRTLMPIERYPDWERRLARQDAFWAGAVIDRPVASIAFSAPNHAYPRPAAMSFASLKDHWLDVYRKCRAAGKGIQLSLEPDELEPFIAEFRPEGVWLFLNGIRNQAEADAVLRRLARWK